MKHQKEHHFICFPTVQLIIRRTVAIYINNSQMENLFVTVLRREFCELVGISGIKMTVQMWGVT